MRFLDTTHLDKQLLGQRIRQARERKGLSQEEFAVLISRDQRAVSEYEHGKRRIAATELPRLADVLDVPVTYFFQGDAALDDIDVLILAELHALPDAHTKQAALELVRVFRRVLGR